MSLCSYLRCETVESNDATTLLVEYSRFFETFILSENLPQGNR